MWGTAKRTFEYFLKDFNHWVLSQGLEHCPTDGAPWLTQQVNEHHYNQWSVDGSTNKIATILCSRLKSDSHPKTTALFLHSWLIYHDSMKWGAASKADMTAFFLSHGQKYVKSMSYNSPKKQCIVMCGSTHNKAIAMWWAQILTNSLKQGIGNEL